MGSMKHTSTAYMKLKTSINLTISTELQHNKKHQLCNNSHQFSKMIMDPKKSIHGILQSSKCHPVIRSSNSDPESSYEKNE